RTLPTVLMATALRVLSGMGRLSYGTYQQAAKHLRFEILLGVSRSVRMAVVLRLLTLKRLSCGTHSLGRSSNHGKTSRQFGWPSALIVTVWFAVLLVRTLGEINLVPL